MQCHLLTIKTGSANVKKGLEIFQWEAERMGAGILRDVMRSRTYCDSGMLGHSTCTCIQASSVLLHTNWNYFIQVYGKIIHHITSVQTLNNIVPVQIHCLLHTNFSLAFLPVSDTDTAVLLQIVKVLFPHLLLKKVSESCISIFSTAKCHRLQSKLLPGCTSTKEKKISATAPSSK